MVTPPLAPMYASYTARTYSGQHKNYHSVIWDHFDSKTEESLSFISHICLSNSQELMNEEQSPFLNTGLHSAIRQSVSALRQCFCLENNQLPLAVYI